MKPKKIHKTAKKATATAHRKKHGLPLGMQKTRVLKSSDVAWQKKSEAFTPMETGQPDQDQAPDMKNPQGVQGGRGPLNQEGEGDRQNDQLAELEQVEPDILNKKGE